jgi:hypothetical protein
MPNGREKSARRWLEDTNSIFLAEILIAEMLPIAVRLVVDVKGKLGCVSFREVLGA